MNKIKFYKEKFLNYCKKENINITEEIIKIFEKTSLENIYGELLFFNDDKRLDNYLEIICEDLILNNISKIERSSMKLGLHRMEKILECLGSPQEKLKIIHIAGTNGKGSVSSYLNTVLSNKYKVGMYTSPAMVSFNDRIRINDKYISYQNMYKLYNQITDIWLEKGYKDENLSFFEILTAGALYYFAEQKVDFVILEVGLGGRYDATNIFRKKEISVITKIGLDHTKILGDTLEEIAYEKAGIIQDKDTLVCYPAKKEVIEVFKEVAKTKSAEINILSLDDIKLQSINKKSNIFSYKNYENIKIKMLGEHQIYNASLAILVLEKLIEKGIVSLTSDEIKNGISKTFWAGRLEWIKENILIDGAHNIDGVKTLIDYVKKHNINKVKFLIGILSDKDYKDMIKLLEELDAKFYITEVPIEQKKSSITELKEIFTKEVELYSDYKIATKELLDNLKCDETLIITGSLYLISAVRSIILDNE